MIRRMIKKTIISISLLCLMVRCGSLEKESISVSRVKTETDIVTILTPSLPLAASPEASICQEIFHKVNDYRASLNLPPYEWSTELEYCAGIRAVEAGQFWSHTRPDGTDWWTLNPAIMYGENLAKGYSTSEQVVQAWKDSPEHNANLVYSDFKYIAIAKVGEYYSAEFCY